MQKNIFSYNTNNNSSAVERTKGRLKPWINYITHSSEILLVYTMMSIQISLSSTFETRETFDAEWSFNHDQWVLGGPTTHNLERKKAQ